VPLAQALLMEFQDLGAVNHNLGPADRLALAPRPVGACLDPLRQANPLLLGDGGEDRQHRIAERTDTAEVFFFEGPPIDPFRVSLWSCWRVSRTPSLVKRSSDQNRTRSNFRSAASRNSRWNSGRLAFLPDTWSTYSPAGAHPSVALLVTNWRSSRS